MARRGLEKGWIRQSHCSLQWGLTAATPAAEAPLKSTRATPGLAETYIGIRPGLEKGAVAEGGISCDLGTVAILFPPLQVAGCMAE